MANKMYDKNSIESLSPSFPLWTKTFNKNIETFISYK